jgi:hypothetical protein
MQGQGQGREQGPGPGQGQEGEVKVMETSAILCKKAPTSAMILGGSKLSSTLVAEPGVEIAA